MKTNLKFKQGFVFIEDIETIIFPMEIFLIFFNELYLSDKQNFEIKLKQIILEDVKNIININLKLNKEITLIKFVNFINKLGFGEINLINKKNNFLIFKIKKQILTKYYLKIFKQNKNSDLFFEKILIYYIQFFLELKNNNKYNVIIKNKSINNEIFLFYEQIINTENIFSINKNNNNIISIFNNLNSYKLINFKNIFPITLNENIMNYNKINKYNIDNNLYLNQFNLKKSISNLIIKVIVSNHFKLDSGILKLWNAFAVLINQIFFLELLNSLNSIKNGNIIIKDIGFIQGIIAVKMKKQKFGVSKENLLKQVIENSQLLGYGKAKFKQINEGIIIELDCFILSYNKNKYNSKNYINILEEYYFNMCLGILVEIYNLDFEIIKISNFKIKLIKKCKYISHSKKQNQYLEILSMKNRMMKL